MFNRYYLWNVQGEEGGGGGGGESEHGGGGGQRGGEANAPTIMISLTLTTQLRARSCDKKACQCTVMAYCVQILH